VAPYSTISGPNSTITTITFNYDQWVSFIAGTPSANAKLFISLPAGPLAANGAPSGEIYYMTPSQLATLVNKYENFSSFGGIMMWNAGFSTSEVDSRESLRDRDKTDLRSFSFHLPLVALFLYQRR
jgi:hypothetical protein